MTVIEKARAKINLSLDIKGRRADGYHLLETVMQSVSLYDTVSVENSEELHVLCDKLLISETQNIAYKAAEAFFEKTDICGGALIRIEKRIPSQAGMGGGSADAAAVLRALNKMFETDLSGEELCALGAKVGADVPFCIKGKTQLARGIGEVLFELPQMPPCEILIVKPEESISTKKAYELADERGFSTDGTEKMIFALKSGDIRLVGKELSNIFDEVTSFKSKDEIKSVMNGFGALGTLMTGSGSAIYGIFEENSRINECKEVLKKKYNEVFSVRPE